MPKAIYASTVGFYQEQGEGVDMSTDVDSGIAYKKDVISLSNSAAAVSRQLLRTESGSIVFVDPSSSTASRPVAITLPEAEAGLWFTILIKKAGGHANNSTSISTGNNDTDFIGVFLCEEDSDNNLLYPGASTSKITFDRSRTAGTMIELCCTGTEWAIINCITDADVGEITLADSA